LVESRDLPGYVGHCRAYVPILLDKLKEKNMICCTNCSDALNHIVRHCATLPDIAEDVVPALDHKNPKVKLETCKLLQVRYSGKILPLYRSMVTQSLLATA
jgi:hypothetical protein